MSAAISGNTPDITERSVDGNLAGIVATDYLSVNNIANNTSGITFTFNIPAFHSQVLYPATVDIAKQSRIVGVRSVRSKSGYFIIAAIVAANKRSFIIPYRLPTFAARRRGGHINIIHLNKTFIKMIPDFIQMLWC